MVQTSPSAQSDRSRTIKKIIKPVWTNGPLDRSGPVVLSLGADHRAPCNPVGMTPALCLARIMPYVIMIEIAP